MANSVVVNFDEIEGVNSAVYATVTFSGTYATGGETITAASLGLNNIESLTADVTSLSATAINAVYLASTGKVALVAPAGTEVANSTSLTGVTATVRALGN